MAFTSLRLSLLAAGLNFGVLVAAQSQQVQFNQVINLNGDMQLNSLVFPDNSKIETFSQSQRQLIVNQNPNPLSANHVVGSTGQPFVQLSQNSMTIQTNRATDLVGGQIEMSIDPNALAQMNVSPDNTFVAQLAPDRQAWIVMEGIKSVNTTDNTVRMIKLNSIDGEYMAVGRQTVETSNVLTTFNQNQQVQISGSGIQEVEFTDGFRMSIKASQPMVVKTDVVNGVSSGMTPGGITSANNFRYLVTSNLAGVTTDLNNMVAVVQLPLNADRLMSMAQQMGAQSNSAIAIGVAQRPVLQNPGGSSIQNLSPQKRQDPASSSSSSVTSAASTASAADATASPASSSSSTSAASATTSAASQQGQPQQGQPQQGSQPQVQLPAANQLLLAPTFTPLTGPPLLDNVNSRLAVPVRQIDGEFIVTMAMAGSAGTIEVAPAQASGAPGAAGESTSGVLAKRETPAAPQGTIVMTMAQLSEMAQRQALGGVTPVWSMMTEFVAQENARAQGAPSIKRFEPVQQGRRATALKV